MELETNLKLSAPKNVAGVAHVQGFEGHLIVLYYLFSHLRCDCTLPVVCHRLLKDTLLGLGLTTT